MPFVIASPPIRYELVHRPTNLPTAVSSLLIFTAAGAFYEVN
jgi:hypothetical protein